MTVGTSNENTHFGASSAVGSGGVIASIRAARAKKEQENFAAYDDLLLSLAKNEPVDPVEVDLTLAMIGRDLAELERDVSAKRKRLSLHAVWSELEDRRQRLRAAELHYQESQQKLNEALAKLQPVVDAARIEVNAATEAVTAADLAGTDLLRDCVDPVILAREAKTLGELRQVREQIRDLDRYLSDWRNRLDTENQNLRYFQKHRKHPSDIALTERQIQDLESKIQRAEAEVGPLRKRQAELDAIGLELNAAKQKP